MNHAKRSAIMILLILTVMSGASVAHASPSKIVSDLDGQMGVTDGQILFAPFYSTTTYLLNMSTESITHTWSSTFLPGDSAYWRGNGTILRPISSGGGGIQKILWDGTTVWDYRYMDPGCTCHHDIKMLPSGNVLMIVWETKTRSEAIAAGRDPGTIPGNTLLPDKIIEVKPTGPTSGDIVWEWHAWDHLIQDFDPAKANYGVVADHSELIDLNFGEFFGSDLLGDWLHTNSVDYNPAFNQILIDVHNFNEVWVIDHGTTTEEAAGHTGGTYGHGGDLLYRWGNPQAYQRGTSADQRLFGQHDASWIKPGYPGEGDILLFNNGYNRPGLNFSSVDEFVPPMDSNGWYYLEPGSAYGPDDVSWSYTADPPSSFYSDVFGGAVRLMNGDTMICDGVAGAFFEVTPEKTVVWQYTNPFPNPTQNQVFKIQYVPSNELPHNKIPHLTCLGSLSWSDVKPGAIVHGSFQVQNTGDPGSLLNWAVNNSSMLWGTWTFSPASGDNLTPDQGPVTVQVDLVVPQEKNAEFQGFLRVENRNNASDFDTVPVILKTASISIFAFLHPFAQMIRQWLSLLAAFVGRILFSPFISQTWVL